MDEVAETEAQQRRRNAHQRDGQPLRLTVEIDGQSPQAEADDPEHQRQPEGGTGAGARDLPAVVGDHVGHMDVTDIQQYRVHRRRMNRVKALVDRR